MLLHLLLLIDDDAVARCKPSFLPCVTHQEGVQYIWQIVYVHHEQRLDQWKAMVCTVKYGNIELQPEDDRQHLPEVVYVYQHQRYEKDLAEMSSVFSPHAVMKISKPERQ